MELQTFINTNSDYLSQFKEHKLHVDFQVKEIENNKNKP